MSSKVLYVDDDEVDREAVGRVVRTWGSEWRAEFATGLQDGQRILDSENEFDVVVADYRLQDGLGKDLIQVGSPWPLIVVTAYEDPWISVELMRSGAHDYIGKDPDRAWLELLKPTVERVMARFRLERKLTERNEDLARLQEEIGYMDRCSTIISNVLTIPLHAATHHLRLLADSPAVQVDGLLSRYCAGALKATSRCSDMLAGLRYYSRIEAGGGQFAAVSLADVARSAMADFPAMRDIDWVTVDDLPTVRADIHQIREVFRQLLRNSIENHPDGRPNVTITASRIGGSHCIAVHDDGPGVAEELHQEVFLPFRTIGGLSERLGLGLAIVEKIVRRHRGQIWIEDADEGGARFVFSIPKAYGDHS